ncbi:MAG: tetratricopeptide repeat protein [Rhodothermaceae bacterium]|nr:tetratricopeptide repeat protein [Rhodothermaceae bacterium]
MPSLSIMARYRFLLYLAGAAVIGLAAYALRPTPEAPPLPDDLTQIQPSAEFVNVEETIAYYRERLRREPDAIEPRVRLAQALMQQARTTGQETDDLPEAQRLLEEALALDPEHYYGRTLQAALYNTLHRFEDARALSEDLLAEYPSHAFVHGTLVDALVELGEYEAAVGASDRMLAIRPGLPSYARASYLRELHGDTEGAIAAMHLAADAEPSGHEGRAWALLQLGTLYLAEAKADTAAFIFEGILEERPNFAPAVGALGHVALVKGEVDEAIVRLEEARLLQPRETFDELLVEAYTLAGDTRRAEAAAERVLESLHAARDMGEIVDMEEADLLADRDQDLDQALRLAQEQVERRPGHLHANETMAWALYKNERADEALPYIEQAMRLNTDDAMVHYRAARIYETVGQTPIAAEHLRRALDGHLRIESPSTAADARTLLAALEGAAPVQAVSTARR